MAITTVSAQLIQFKSADEQVVVNIKTTASAVSLVRGAGAKYNTSIKDVNALADALGTLAFSNGIANATESAPGLMSAADKTKLDGIAAQANKYVHPASAVGAGTYRSVTVDVNGHVTAGTNPTTLAGYGITDAAAKSHKHGDGDITGLDASKLTGTIAIERLPHGALERCKVVETDAQRLALTTADVQKGDTVKVTDTGKMYFVVDDTKLNTEDGYEIYTAGSATTVPWAGVTGKPTSFTPSAHTQAMSTITGLETALNGKAANTDMTGASGSAAGTHGLVPAPSAGANTRYLRSDGTWVTPPNTTYSPVTTTANGLMIASDKAKLDGIAVGANKYVHPTGNGNNHIPANGAAGQVLGYNAAGTAAWQDLFFISSNTPSAACMWLKTV